MLYFDHNATTPVAPEVADAYLAAVHVHWGNPSSVHAAGQAAREALEAGRRTIGQFLGARATEVVLTSGGTESNNLAIFGAVRAAPETHGTKHVITTTIEHAAVLGPCAQLEREGVQVTYLPVDQDGVVDPEEVRRAIRPETVLISIMHANNETGVIQPIREIAAIARERHIVMHSDGVQAVGKVALNLNDLGVHLYSISAHKLYAPKGIGALFVAKDTRLTAMQFGGRHERERRAGTENVPGAMALAKATDRVTFPDSSLRDQFESHISEAFPNCTVNSANAPRLPNTSCITFGGISGESLVIALDMRGMAVSSGSACSSGSTEPSHVLLAMGRSAVEAKATVRFSFGESNATAEVQQLAEATITAVHRLRKTKPREVTFA